MHARKSCHEPSPSRRPGSSGHFGSSGGATRAGSDRHWSRALSGHVFGNEIDFFGKHDILDLAGLHFHAGATAKYHPATEVLAVHSGHTTDKLTLVSPHGTHFEAASDHHGGTDVFLFFA